MPYKTFIDISMGILQEIVLCICLKKDCSESNRDHLGTSLHCYLKTKITEYI